MSVESFLQAIRAEPEDDTLRLVFADWLDDHGQPERAEFIRLQIESARLDDWGEGMVPFAGRPVLTAREEELRAVWIPHWLGELPEHV